MSEPEVPKELETIARKVLSHKPKPVSQSAKARKRKAKRIEKEKSVPS